MNRHALVLNVIISQDIAGEHLELGTQVLDPGTHQPRAFLFGQLGERHRTGERIFRDNVRAAKMAMLAALALLMVELLLVNTRYRRIP